MKRIITLYEFVEQYLEPLQYIYVEDLENDYIYFQGLAKDFLNLDDILTSGRILAIHEYTSLTSKNGIVLYI